MKNGIPLLWTIGESPPEIGLAVLYLMRYEQTHRKLHADAAGMGAANAELAAEIMQRLKMR